MFMNWTNDPVLDAERYDEMIEEMQKVAMYQETDEAEENERSVSYGSNGF